MTPWTWKPLRYAAGGVPDPGAPDGDWGICIQSAARAFGDDGKHPGNVKAFGRTGKEI